MCGIFSGLFEKNFWDYSLFLYAGMIPWLFFSNTLSQSSSSFISNEGLIKKIYIPKIIFPTSVAITTLIDSIPLYIILLLISIIVNQKMPISIIMMPVVLILLFIFTYGVSLLIAIGTVFFRDLQHIISIFLQGLFFLTPVIYESSKLGPKSDFLISLNPLSYFVNIFRTIIIKGEWPKLGDFLICVAYSILSITIGMVLFKKFQKKLVYRL
jgi:ABC-2 type transport system permease protein/lipopolysaccharide transport system permease protein